MGADRNQWQFPRNRAGGLLGWRDDGKGMENKVLGEDIQEHSDNLDELATVTPGAAGKDMLAAQTEDEAAAVVGLPPVTADTMLVDNTDGTDREAKGFAVVKNLLGYFDTEADFLAANISTALQYVETAGYSAKGDGGAHRKVRIAGPGTEPWQKQSADGAWWDIADQAEYAAEIFGLGAGGADTGSWETAADFITTRGGALRVPAGEFTLTNDWLLTSSAQPFRIIGAGKDATIFKRAKTGVSTFWGVQDCSNYEIADLTLNGQKSVVGTGSHGLRLNRGSNIAVRRVHVTDHTDTGIIFFDSANLETQYDSIVFDECSVDGLGSANNGLLISNSTRARMLNCNVKDLGHLGDPNFGIQFKGRNSDGLILGGTVSNARAGVAIGSSDPVYPSNVDCHAIGVSVHGCTRGARIAASEYCTISLDTIDMDNASDAGNPVENAAEAAVYIFNANNCGVHVKHIRGYEDSDDVIYVGTAAGNTIIIDAWRNVPDSLKFIKWDTGASGNTVILHTCVGTRPDFWMDRVNSVSTSANTFRVSDDVMAQRTTIASDAITILNPAVARYRLDTEGAAATDNLATINGGTDGQVVTFTTTNDARDVVLKHNTGNIFLKGAVDRTLGTINDIVMLMFSSFANKWIEI